MVPAMPKEMRENCEFAAMVPGSPRATGPALFAELVGSVVPFADALQIRHRAV